MPYLLKSLQKSAERCWRRSNIDEWRSRSRWRNNPARRTIALLPPAKITSRYQRLDMNKNTGVGTGGGDSGPLTFFKAAGLVPSLSH